MGAGDVHDALLLPAKARSLSIFKEYAIVLYAAYNMCSQTWQCRGTVQVIGFDFEIQSSATSGTLSSSLPCLLNRSQAQPEMGGKFRQMVWLISLTVVSLATTWQPVQAIQLEQLWVSLFLYSSFRIPKDSRQPVLMHRPPKLDTWFYRRHANPRRTP